MKTPPLKEITQIFLILLVLIGCSTSPKEFKSGFTTGKRIAWSLKVPDKKLIVAVSPTGKTLRIAGTSGVVIGGLIDTAVNARIEEKINLVLADYDPVKIVKKEIERGLSSLHAMQIDEMHPLETTAGYKRIEDAQQAHYRHLQKLGYEFFIDLDVSSGLYGPDAILVTKLNGTIISLTDQKILKRVRIITPFGPVLVDSRWGDPTNFFSPDISGFRINKQAIELWFGLEGQKLKKSHEELAIGVVAAFFTLLGCEESSLGNYYLGKNALCRKDFALAFQYFDRAYALEPDFIEACSARAVAAIYSSDNTEDAISVLERALNKNPGYGAAWYNLSWWYAFEKKDIQKAKQYFLKAKEANFETSNEKLQSVLDLAS